MSLHDDSQTSKPFDLELDELLDPAGAFDHPRCVVDDADLTVNEKRAILARWASDACALETMPTLRRLPKGRRPVPIDDIFDALKDLDRRAMSPTDIRLVRRSEIEVKRQRRSGGSGALPI
jgi:hypothetical protein